MKLARVTITVFVALMLLLPLLNYVETELEASPLVTMGFNPNLALTSARVQPDFKRLPELNEMVFIRHTVKQGEDLSRIAKIYGVDQFTIRSSNEIDFGSVEPGRVLYVPNQRGTLYEVKNPESFESIMKNYSRSKSEPAAFRREIIQANGFPLPDLRNDATFPQGTRIFLPKVFNPSGMVIPFINTKGMRFTSGFGSRRHPVQGIRKFHSGLDIAKPHGSPVVAARTGAVVFAGWSGGYGKMIELEHTAKSKSGVRIIRTRYGHLSAINVRVGQRVKMGQMIGRVGSTGLSTGPHLHFEVRDASGRANNPRKYL